MRKFKLIACALVLTMSLAAVAACSGSDEDDVVVISQETEAEQAGDSGETEDAEGDGQAASESDAYTFVYNGATVVPGGDLNEVLETLGDNYTYFEAASCAGFGLTKTYTYNNGSFVISTNSEDDKDIVTNISIYDDTVSTPEGVYIGDSSDSVKEVYGQPDSETETTMTYTKGDSVLVFVITDGTVTYIVYNYTAI